MAYDFAQAGTAMAIAEQEYGSAQTVQFTKFTSCIGLMALYDGRVTAVHLVVVSRDDTTFDNAAAQAAVNLLPAGYTQVVVIGQTSIWRANLRGPYDHLLGLLRSPVIIDRNDGTYGGRFDGTRFQYSDNGRYTNVP